MRSSDDTPRPALLKWLLDSDPAIRWQVMRDLTDAPAAAIASASRWNTLRALRVLRWCNKAMR